MTLTVICLDARHAKAALSLRLNKTDANDAEGLAQIVRTGWYRQVQVKSLDSHLIRTLLAARAGLVAMHRDVANHIRGALKTFGLVLGKVAAGTFEARVRQLIANNPLLVEVIEALLKVWRTTGEQLVTLHRRVLRLTQTDETCRRLMTVPGVGAVTADCRRSLADAGFELSGCHLPQHQAKGLECAADLVGDVPMHSHQPGTGRQQRPDEVAIEAL